MGYFCIGIFCAFEHTYIPVEQVFFDRVQISSNPNLFYSVKIVIFVCACEFACI